jgi:hypothetical protein
LPGGNPRSHWTRFYRPLDSDPVDKGDTAATGTFVAVLRSHNLPVGSIGSMLWKGLDGAMMIAAHVQLSPGRRLRCRMAGRMPGGTAFACVNFTAVFMTIAKSIFACQYIFR